MSVRAKLFAVVLPFLFVFSNAYGQDEGLILFHGGGAGPDSGADAAVFEFLIDKLGEDNVFYMSGADAAADGSSADGFQGVVISSTLGSGSVRDKYEDSPKNVLQWEEALVDISSPGDFFLSEAAAKPALTEITILEDHFITAGFEGVVEVTNTPITYSVGTGEVGEGVRVLAAASDDPESGQHAIMIAEAGGALLGDGSAGSPEFAAGRRMHFFLENNTFNEITEDGAAIFGRAIDWILSKDLASGDPGDYNGDGAVTLADFLILRDNFNSTFPIEDSFSKGDENLDGRVDLNDFIAFRATFEAQAAGEPSAVPEPTASLLSWLGVLGLMAFRRRQNVKR